MQMQLLVLSGKKVCATQKASGEKFHQRAKRAQALSGFFLLSCICLGINKFWRRLKMALRAPHFSVYGHKLNSVPKQRGAGSA
jgi:hypothetical protein